MKLKGKKRKFIYNIDGSDALAYINEDAGINQLIEYIFNPLEGTEIDTITVMLGCGSFAEYPSKILPLIGEMQENNLKSIGAYKRFINAKKFIDSGIDILDEIIKEGHNRNIDVFFSFRTNDIHDHWDEHLDFLPKFKKDRPHWLNPKEYFPDYKGKCEINTSLNYIKKEVRDFKKKILDEIIEKYDFDGIEIDFLRSQFNFRWDKGYTYAYVITDFVKEVRKALDNKALITGKRMELAVKVCTTVGGSMEAGFDVEKWVEDDIVDLIISGTGGLNIDTKSYMKLVKESGVSFYPCLYGDYEKTASDDLSMRGAASALLMDKPDGLYCFNIYPVERHRQNLLRQISSLEKMEGLNKTYFVDVNYDYNLSHEEWRHGFNLPAELGETSCEYLKIPIKIVLEKNFSQAKILLKAWIRNITQQDNLSYLFNGIELNCPVWVRKEDGYLQYWLVWEISKDVVKTENVFEIKLNKRNRYLEKKCSIEIMRVNMDILFED